MPDPKSTPLVSAHRAAGARMVDFAGFLMPLQYSGIVDEHRAVRTAAGLFDVSHMGQLFFRGPDALPAIDRLVTNDVSALANGQALYTPICRPDGGIIDDCLVYRMGAHEALVIVNAANRQKDLDWFVGQAPSSTCQVDDESDAHALIALQGCRAAEILAEVAADAHCADIARFHVTEAVLAGGPCTAARTGYTGEDGFELLCQVAHAPTLWDALMRAGDGVGLKPCGLGARDTLRLEARLPLHGHDIDESTTPLEAGLGWTVKLKKQSAFIGQQALTEQRAQGVSRKLVGLIMRSRGIARHGHTIHRPIAGDAPSTSANASFGPEVGQVTSGTQSPTLNQAIALGYVPTAQAKPGTSLVVNVRDKPVQAEVIKGPFYRRE